MLLPFTQAKADNAIINLSKNSGIAYLALSHVCSLSGVHLVSYDPSCIKVSCLSIIELNRLRKTYMPGLPNMMFLLMHLMNLDLMLNVK